MFKIIYADKDAYVTNRVVNGVAQVNANVGAAGSLDLFKVYGLTSSGSIPNTELSRLLVHFDMTSLRSMVAAGQLDLSNPTFSCHLQLSDVYGGQPTPRNFTLSIAALSSSFDEGLGRDVVLYADQDVCNWLTSSYATGSWFVTGCGLGGTGSCDWLTTNSTSQVFTTGEEDLNVNVTPIVSGVLSGLLPDAGFRIAFSSNLEADQQTYFVKRFASRTAFNNDLQPRMVATWDDSIQDDTNNVFFDSPATLFFYNYVQSQLATIVSGTSPVTGSNCMLLTLSTPVSGGLYGLVFNTSQHKVGQNLATGIYSASIEVSSNDSMLQPQLEASGSVTFTPIWTSRDGTVTYSTGPTFKAYPPQRGDVFRGSRKFAVAVLGLQKSLSTNEQTVLRVNIFDYTQSYVSSVSRLPVDLPGIIVRDVHYQVRDQVTDRIVIPFDTVTNSTRISNDSLGMYFVLDSSNLTNGHTYVIDVLILSAGNQQLYKAASPAFRVGDVA
jgi:hypothetical protein